MSSPWISVCDRMPAAGQLVRVRGRVDHFDGSRTCTVARLEYHDGQEYWEVSDGYIGETIVEWMPLGDSPNKVTRIGP